MLNRRFTAYIYIYICNYTIIITLFIHGCLIRILHIHTNTQLYTLIIYTNYNYNYYKYNYPGPVV